MHPGTLYVVATPIGNLGDITLRAIEVLRVASLIACEDTRRTRTLLDRHGIAVPLVSYHKFNERKSSASIVRRLLDGESVALVCDGGTPAFSDPGYRLVADALEAGITVTPVPGACALVAAVSASGLPSDCVTFHGFLPHRAGERRRAIEAISGDAATQVFYESPHRVAASIRDLASILGPRRAAVVREMTKKFETWYRGTLPEIAERIGQEAARGEFCIVIEGSAPGRRARRGAGPEASPGNDGEMETRGAGRTAPATSGMQPEGPAALRRAYEQALASGLDRREALKLAAHECGMSRKEAYRILMAG